MKRVSKEEKMVKFMKVLKKVVPWLIGGAAAAGGLVLGWKMCESSTKIEANEAEPKPNDVNETN